MRPGDGRAGGRAGRARWCAMATAPMDAEGVRVQWYALENEWTRERAAKQALQ